MQIKLIIISLLFCSSLTAQQFSQGIYVSQATLGTKRLESLIAEAKAAKVDTFVVDMEKPSSWYGPQIAKVKQAGLKYVARIVVFPDGGTADLIKSPAYWEKKYALVSAAIGFGADEIQLDYIRYKSKNRPSQQNAKDVHEVIKWFKAKLTPQNIPLQIDVFGIALQSESLYIGQNLKLFAQSVDVMCPMTYPSHYEPYMVHSKAPYNAVKGLLDSMKKQLNNEIPFRTMVYIETGNYRYSMNNAQKRKYISEQIRAARDAGASGWYAWSPQNQYGNLFAELTAQNAMANN